VLGEGEKVGAALTFDHVEVAVLRLPAKRGDEPRPPDEEAGEDLEADEQRPPTFASLPHAWRTMDRS
jgi:hypothetical protein